MYILSPKSNFLGGALVSASHLGKLFPDKLLVWKNQSSFLDSNGVKYKIVNSDDWYTLQYRSCENPILVNDTCVDGGYFQQYQAENAELIDFIDKFDTIYLVNHQPVNRCIDYLRWFIHKLNRDPYKAHNIILLNYRAWWNIEWQNELALEFPDIKVYTSPYHYYLPYLDESKLYNKKFYESGYEYKTVMIGRSNSRCKIHSEFDKINKYLGYDLKAEQVYPDPNCNNTDFLKLLSGYKYVLTGYYYGGEGTREMDVPYNKLEWSFIDAMLAGSTPVTSSLFSSELKRLGIPAPMIDYDIHRNLSNEDLYMKLLNNGLRVKDIFDEGRRTLIAQLEKGNKQFRELITND